MARKREGSAKEAVFALLNEMRPGTTFTGPGLQFMVRHVTGKEYFQDTITRYLRQWRTLGGSAVCIYKPLRVYKITRSW